MELLTDHPPEGFCLGYNPFRDSSVSNMDTELPIIRQSKDSSGKMAAKGAKASTDIPEMQDFPGQCSKSPQYSDKRQALY